VTLQCYEIRGLLDALVGDQLLIETTNDIVRHLEKCSQCRADLEERIVLRGRLQSAFEHSGGLAPRGNFLNHVKSRLSEQSTIRRSWRTWLESWMRHWRKC